MFIKCSQCDKQAIGNIGENGPAFCLEHMSMFQNMISKHLDDLRQQEDSIFDMVEMSTGFRLRPPRPVPIQHTGNVTVNNMKIEKSQIGIVNTGVINNLNSTINSVEQGGNQELAKNIKDFAEAILVDQKITKEQQREILESLDVITKEILNNPENRKKTVIDILMGKISNTTQFTANAMTIWQILQPLILSYFK